MADIALGSVAKIIKVGLDIKKAVKTVRRNEADCQAIQKLVVIVIFVLSQLRETMRLKGPAVEAALMSLEETLDRALKLVIECQERHIVRHFFKAQDTSEELRRLREDIHLNITLGHFAISVQTTTVLENNPYAGASPPLRPQDAGGVEISYSSHSTTDDARSGVNSVITTVATGSEVPYAPTSGLTEFSLSELEATTHHFSELNIIGEGGHSFVSKENGSKQKIVIMVSMRCSKQRFKAMTLVARVNGVSSIGVTGDRKDRLEVVGCGVDTVCLVRCLRKKVGYTEILLVEEVKEKKKPEGPEIVHLEELDSPPRDIPQPSPPPRSSTSLLSHRRRYSPPPPASQKSAQPHKSNKEVTGSITSFFSSPDESCEKSVVSPDVKRFFIAMAKGQGDGGGFVRCQFEMGKTLIHPDKVGTLPYQLRHLHEWYMNRSNQDILPKMIAIRYKEEYFHNTDDLFWLDFNELYQLYQEDALDVSLIRCWILMEIQICRNNGNHRIGFLDPGLVNEKLVKDNSKEIEDYIFNAMLKQEYKNFILLPYNFDFHWILLLIQPYLSKIIVLDSLRKPQNKFQDLIDLLNRAFARYCKRSARHAPYKNDFFVRTDFPSMRQDQGNNLCGFYVCMNMHALCDDRENVFQNDVQLKTSQLLHEIIAIQEQLAGFINEQVIHPNGEFHDPRCFDVELYKYLNHLTPLTSPSFEARDLSSSK